MMKTIKVQYSTRFTGRKYSEVPKIQMEGKWLEAIGFSVGDKIRIDYDNGKIIIRTDKETANA
ncbi:MAG: SymE family type I addiction module toxin [Lachnospiraceae bacterium]|nr:SymE family type I addiction module toxin [Lachnospiraceae bacterium]